MECWMSPATPDIQNAATSRRDVDLGPEHEQLLTRPSFCNAKYAYNEVRRGRANGNRAALWLRLKLQDLLFALGCRIQEHYGKVLIFGVLILVLLAVGLKLSWVETEVDKLWVEVGGRLEKELEYRKEIHGEGTGSTYEAMISTPVTKTDSILNQDALKQHLQSAQSAIQVEVEVYGINWNLRDLCYTGDYPLLGDGNLINVMLEKLIPCVIITPLDCFWEGSKLLGPKTGLKYSAYSPDDIFWTNFDPLNLTNFLKLCDYGIDIEEIEELLVSTGINHGYVDRPCLDPQDQACPQSAPNHPTKGGVIPDIASVLSGGCNGYASAIMEWPEELIVGGTEKNTNGQLERAQALQTLIQLKGWQDLYDYYKDDVKVIEISWTEEKAKEILEEWQKKFTEVVAASSNSTKDQKLLAFSSSSLNEILEEFSQANYIRIAGGYLIMLLYACLTMMKLCNLVQSQGGVAICGVLLVSLSVAAGLGFCSLVGITFNASTTQILPFLALGVGIDDMFLLVHSSSKIGRNVPFMHQTGEVLKRAGLSVLITSVNNNIAFFVAAIIPIPALRSLSLQFAILVIFNFLTIILVFPAVLALDFERRNEKRIDILFCFTRSRNSSRIINVQPRCGGEQPESPLPNRRGRLQSTSTAETRITMESTATVQAVTHAAPAPGQQCTTVINPTAGATGQAWDHPIPASQVSSRPSTANSSSYYYQRSSPETSSRCKNWRLSHLVKKFYIPLLQKATVKVVVLILFTGLLGAGIYGVIITKDGLDLTDVVPKDTNQFEFLEANGEYFSFYSMHAVTKDNYDYAGGQTLLLDYHASFDVIKEITRTPDGLMPKFWLQFFKEWLLDKQKAFDRDWSKGYITGGTTVGSMWNGSASENGVLGFKLLIQTGDPDNPYDTSQVQNTRLVNEQGIIHLEAFYNYLTAWVNIDSITYSASQADIQPVPPSYSHDGLTDYELQIPKSQAIVYAQIPFYLTGLQNTQDIVRVINQARDVCEEYSSKGLANFPSGVPFTYWEQYINLRFYLAMALLSVLAAIFVVVTVLLVNPWAAMIEVLMLIMMTVELFGFMGLTGLQLSAIPAVILIFSVGVGVEFTLHIMLGYITSIGSRNKRMAIAVEQMFSPVLDGAISTLLGVIMLSGSEFDFIVRYFFLVLAALVVIGVLNGLVLMPVILSLVGPLGEVRPINNADRLSTPSPSPSPPSSPPLTYPQLSSAHPRAAASSLDQGFIIQTMRPQVYTETVTGDHRATNSADYQAFQIQPEFVVETKHSSVPKSRVKHNHKRENVVDTSYMKRRPKMEEQCSGYDGEPQEDIRLAPLPHQVTTTTVTATARVSIVHHGQHQGQSGHSFKYHRRRASKKNDLKLQQIEYSEEEDSDDIAGSAV